MSRLDARLRVLEREATAELGCPACMGRLYIGLPDGEPFPAWLDEQSCCRRCGTGVKVWPQSMLDRL